jgi:hypothetical protein
MFCYILYSLTCCFADVCYCFFKHTSFVVHSTIIHDESDTFKIVQI